MNSPIIRLKVLVLIAFLVSGCGGGGGGQAASVAEVLELNVTTGGVKTLRFSWSAFEGAAYYKLMVNPDGASGFVQEGADITGTSADVVIPVHLTDWINASYLLEAYDSDDALISSSSPETVTHLMLSSIGYFKASNTGADDAFGFSVALSGDGTTLAVGAPFEDSGTTGVNSTPDEGAPTSGAVYLFRQASGTGWSQEAYIKASKIGPADRFGWSVALSDNGNTLAVGGWDVAYLFRYDSGTGWAEQADLKGSNTEETDLFGYSVDLSADGNRLAVGAFRAVSYTHLTLPTKRIV